MPARIDVVGTFELEASPARAFDLFTPRGEQRWVDGWAPRFVHPTDGRLEVDQVFVTSVGGEETIWSVVRHDAEAHEVEYLRVVPGARVARVSVGLSATDAGGSAVTVRYLCTALSDDAHDELAAFEAGFDAMLAEWRRLTSEQLAG